MLPLQVVPIKLLWRVALRGAGTFRRASIQFCDLGIGKNDCFGVNQCLADPQFQKENWNIFGRDAKGELLHAALRLVGGGKKPVLHTLFWSVPVGDVFLENKYQWVRVACLMLFRIQADFALILASAFGFARAKI
ncbi:hypothetical protein ACSBLW_08765 [Thioclava sp. FR2]|uniref:hypothetical protein n=1 Tax=Thioclava sp. FR2 TaxID=3445780 RepID=UPI003EB6ABB9